MYTEVEEVREYQLLFINSHCIICVKSRCGRRHTLKDILKVITELDSRETNLDLVQNHNVMFVHENHKCIGKNAKREFGLVMTFRLGTKCNVPQ